MAILTFDAAGTLVNILYPDGSEMFGDVLEEYNAFMAQKFGARWETEKNTLRLCSFDAVNRPPERDVVQDGESRLDAKEFSAVWTCSPKGELIGIRYLDGSELFGEAIAEQNAMHKEKYGHLWEANRGKLKARRVDSLDLSE